MANHWKRWDAKLRNYGVRIRFPANPTSAGPQRRKPLETAGRKAIWGLNRRSPLRDEAWALPTGGPTAARQPGCRILCIRYSAKKGKRYEKFEEPAQARSRPAGGPDPVPGDAALPGGGLRGPHPPRLRHGADGGTPVGPGEGPGGRERPCPRLHGRPVFWGTRRK